MAFCFQVARRLYDHRNERDRLIINKAEARQKLDGPDAGLEQQRRDHAKIIEEKVHIRPDFRSVDENFPDLATFGLEAHRNVIAVPAITDFYGGVRPAIRKALAHNGVFQS